jgi:predicted flavoprotein YhiN
MEKVLLKKFVNAGGINLKEINFKTMESSYMKTYILGEIVNIDAITGGFNPECLDEWVYFGE